MNPILSYYTPCHRWSAFQLRQNFQQKKKKFSEDSRNAQKMQVCGGGECRLRTNHRHHRRPFVDPRPWQHAR